MIFTNPLNALQEEDLQALVESQTPEGKTVEYKGELPGGMDSDKKEFLLENLIRDGVEPHDLVKLGGEA